MGHYAMRGVSCETLYGDSNTLVPGFGREYTHKKKAIMNDDSYQTMEMHRIITSLAPSSLGSKLEGES